jgi:hypothetical protein
MYFVNLLVQSSEISGGQRNNISKNPLPKSINFYLPFSPNSTKKNIFLLFKKLLLPICKIFSRKGVKMNTSKNTAKTMMNPFSLLFQR